MANYFYKAIPEFLDRIGIFRQDLSLQNDCLHRVGKVSAKTLSFYRVTNPDEQKQIEDFARREKLIS